MDGIFIHRFTTKKVDKKVVLNQKTRMKEDTFPNSNTKSKEFIGFIVELASFVNNLNENDFTEEDGYKLHHSSVTIKGNVAKNHTNLLEDFISPKILDKLYKDKYQQ